MTSASIQAIVTRNRTGVWESTGLMKKSNKLNRVHAVTVALLGITGYAFAN